jgi:GMP synthase - Glutamine amidotransferase domain
MAQHKIHVAVLDADIPCLSVYKARGLYSSQFRVLLQAAAQRLNEIPETLKKGPLAVHVTAFDAVGGSLPPLETLRTNPQSPAEPHAGGPLSPIDAILITGSVSSAYEDEPWIYEMQSYIQTVHTHYPNIKLFGSCFGHQIIAQSLLSTKANPNSPLSSTFHVAQSPAGFEMGIQPITLQPSFTACFPPLARATAQNSFRIQLIHGDAVVPTPETEAAADQVGISLPAPWSSIGSSAQCAIQGLYNPGRVLTYQGHFEFDTFVNGELVQEIGRRAGWSAAVVAEYLEQIYRSHIPGLEDDDDAKAAAEAVLLFFAGEEGDLMECGGGTGIMTPPLD